MREVTRDQHFTDDSMGRLEQEQVENPRGSGPDETQLVIVALLMRLYDIQMALLSLTDKELADAIHDAHAEGSHFNPQIFIPKPVEVEENTGE